MKEICDELVNGKNVRQNLSALRKWLKDGGKAGELAPLVAEKEELFFRFLADKEAKTRKNAALLLGDLRYEPAILPLYQTYRDERTRFVKSAYLEALGNYGSGQLDGAFEFGELAERGRLLEQALRDGMLEGEPVGESRKHLEEELWALRKLLILCGGVERHPFLMQKGSHQVVLTTGRLHREVVRRLAEDALGKRDPKEGKESPMVELHPLGVRIRTEELAPLFGIRAFREMLFLSPQQKRFMVSAIPGEAATQLAPWLAQLCQTYCGEPARYYFRVDCRSDMTPGKRGDFVKKLGLELEVRSGGVLINSAGDYELELRLIQTREGEFFPCVRFCGLPDHRFDYRKNAISASIHPSSAALMMELVRPYLKEGARLYDPFCGVGTMLIERDFAVPARDKYGTDIFGEAVGYGRENALLAGKTIHFIHRDFGDFKHEYAFDEIITNMPVRGKRTKEEMDGLYAVFFARAAGLLKPGAVIIMYTNETGFVKKQLRLHREYELLQETLMQEQTGFSLLVIGVRK